ncbi:MAG: Maf family nucleotide pyrophosphatase [Bacteroidota bacterium]|nr:Maf family nucleotide pyrophosphatase [Bacteroidota bacterium]
MKDSLDLSGFELVLASNSPRRQQFMRELGLPFTVRVKEVDESYPNELKEQQITEYIAVQKAKAYQLQDIEILITSDTLVCLDNKVLGKPSNRQEAVQMLTMLSDNTHKVITSVCFTSNKSQQVFSEVTEVVFSELTPYMIAYYVDNYSPLDKAGAYGIQEWIGLVGVKSIRGSYTNVVGFPTEKFYRQLKEFICLNQPF